MDFEILLKKITLAEYCTNATRREALTLETQEDLMTIASRLGINLTNMEDTDQLLEHPSLCSIAQTFFAELEAAVNAGTVPTLLRRYEDEVRPFLRTSIS